MRKILFIIATVLVLGFSSASAVLPHNPDENRSENVASPSVYEGVGSVSIVNPGNEITFTIYSITGQVVKSFVMPTGNASIELPKGFYIIKCNLWSRKIVIK